MGKRFIRKTIGPAIELVPMCPLCRANIYWSLYSGKPGAKAEAYCSNNIGASRIIFDTENIVTCEWSGYVVRNRHGTVDIYSNDGKAVPHKVVKHNPVVLK